MIASGSSSLGSATRALASLWARLSMEQVVRTDVLSMGRSALGMARDLCLGGLLGRTVTLGVLDASPLRAFLARTLPLAGIGDSIRAGHLYAVAISTTSYHSGRSFTFVEGRTGHPSWQKSRRVVLPVRLTVDHVCASAAIPIVFPPVRIASAAGDLWFGDGGLRLVTPFSPAIRSARRTCWRSASARSAPRSRCSARSWPPPRTARPRRSAPRWHRCAACS
jgi:NTE family protein